MVHDSEYLLLQRLDEQASLSCVGRQLGVALAAFPIVWDIPARRAAEVPCSNQVAGLNTGY